jgi:hypothetical protein
MKKKEEQTSEEVYSYDIWREKEAERLDPLLEALEYEHKVEVRRLLIEAFYAGEREGINKAYERIRERDAK